MAVTEARQEGKSYIIRETAKNSFANYVELNMQEDYDGERLFAEIRTTKDFHLQVSALYGNNLNNNNDTIIFIDEIQVYPNLLSLLKPLKLERRYRCIASGSLLDIELKHQFISMGSIEEVKMHPMDFEEFLLASNVKSIVIAYLKECFDNMTIVSDSIHIWKIK